MVLVGRIFSVRKPNLPPSDLMSLMDRNADIVSELPNETRVTLESASADNQIDTIFQYLVGLFSFVDHPNGPYKHPIAHCLFHCHCVWHLVPRTCRGNFLGRRIAPSGNVNQVDTMINKHLRKSDRVLNLPAWVVLVLKKISGRDTQKDREIFWDIRPNQISDLNSQADTVLKAAAILVPPVVGDGREKRMQEIAMCIVNFYSLLQQN